jgi:hypothetical protein
MTLRSLWFAMLAAPLAALASPAGFVLELRGEWRLEGAAAPLAVGSEVPAGGLLRNGKPEARDAITIVAARTGKILLAKHCTAARDCEGLMALPPAAQDNAPDAIATLLEKVAARLRGSPSRYVATITRSERVISDAVVELAGGHLAMAPALAGMAPGTYEVALRPLQCAGGRDCAPIELASEYRWDPAGSQPLPARGVAPGLFELEAAPSTTAYLPQPSHAWVRVSSGERFARDAAAYRAARELAAGWGSEAGPAVRQTFLRGVLASLED